ncbi:hypothetical protein B0T26DRAFT_619536, partial [Lasiosphaeria miniovina]
FPFERLPWKVQASIFHMWLFKYGQLVHAFSRLDPFEQPAAFPNDEELGRQTGFKHVFYWGSSRCNITHDCFDPNDVLRVLLVSKRFLFIGAHCFYGLNTFAFSSLGEFARFSHGIGYARLDRLQHVEITLVGSQYVTEPADAKDRTPFSQRTHALTWLPDCHRLRTLVFHINESGKNYVRRRYEPDALKEFMAEKTNGQPNKRILRSLRCVQGIDYVYQLRGLSCIRFYDLFKAAQQQPSGSNSGERTPVEDWSIIEDINNTGTMAKGASRREYSQLENLQPLLKDERPPVWQPGADDWAAVKSVFI